jgi:hypothetical protein
MHCHLLIPDFFSSAGTERLAAAETLVAKGRCRRLAPAPVEEWLFGRFEVLRQRDWPVAPYALLADGGAPAQHYWLRADPVHLLAGNGSLTLAAGGPAASRAEAEALVETLNRHFGADFLFYPMQPERWYLRLAAAPDLRTTPCRVALGKSVGEVLPAGADAMRFNALMNEAQMLLHEHPVNEAREARGALAINSIWFWGGGTLAVPGTRPFGMVVGDDPLARGLALAAGIPVRALPENAEGMLGTSGDKSVVLVVPHALDGAADRAEAARALERDWLAPLLEALRSGRIGMLTLHLAGAGALLEIEVARSDLRHFWRLRKPLAAYA